MLVSMKTLCHDCLEPFTLLGEGPMAAHYCFSCGTTILPNRSTPQIVLLPA